MRTFRQGGGKLVVAVVGAGLCSLLMGAQGAFAADFTVTSPGFFYSINGQSPNPVLTLERGKTYTFEVHTAASHPFEILGGGAVNNNISSGTITYTVPMDAKDQNYICSIHGFGNKISTVEPPPVNAPTFQILSLSVSTNIELISLGTNTFTLFPEFATNIPTTNWFALTVQTNTFLNGTNDTICGRPPGDNVFIRLRAEPSQTP